MMTRALGPTLVSGRDMNDLFKKKSSRITFPSANIVPKFEPLSKVLVLGSGGLSIGQVFRAVNARVIVVVNVYRMFDMFETLGFDFGRSDACIRVFAPGWRI